MRPGMFMGWVFLLGAAATASAAGSMAPVVMPLVPYLGVIPSLQVSIDGHPSTFLLDTAGGLTVFTPEVAKAVGCKPWGQLTGFRMRGDRVDTARCDNVRLSLAGATVDMTQAGVWDISKLLPKDAPPLGGSLALDAFAGRVVTLDLSGGKFILETQASLKERVRHATEVPMRLVREVGGASLVPVVAIDTPKGRVWMELDCGSDGEVIVNRPLAEALGLDPKAKGAQPLAMSLAGGMAVKAKGQVMDLVIDGNIGAPVLKQWVITMDLAHEKLWLAPKG
ncbi:MAG TPA: aspartyl protease family protein [Luteibacter sp.]|nr:aspartyl protease family protein [Luteibacter sp.]